MVPLAFRGAFYHISFIDQGAKAGFLDRIVTAALALVAFGSPAKRIW
jgi:hypothetical protein